MYEGNVLISWFAIAGGLLIAALAFQHPLVFQRPDDLRRLAGDVGATLFAAAFAFGAIAVLNGCYEVVLHRTALTPERLLATLARALLVLPFFLSFDVILRRCTTVLSN